MAGFYYPSSGTMVRVCGLVGPLLTSGSDVDTIASFRNSHPCTREVIPFVGTKILLHSRAHIGTPDNNAVEKHLQLRNIMPIRPGYDEGQRDATLVYENVTLCSHFFPGPWGLARRTRVPAGLSPLRSPRSATPRQFPPSRRTRPTLLSTKREKNLRPAISGNKRGQNSDYRNVPLEAPSTGIQSVVRKGCLQRLFSGLVAFFRPRPCACTPSSDLDAAEESAIRRSPKTHQKLPKIVSFPSSASREKGYNTLPLRENTIRYHTTERPLFTDKL